MSLIAKNELQERALDSMLRLQMLQELFNQVREEVTLSQDACSGVARTIEECQVLVRTLFEDVDLEAGRNAADAAKQQIKARRLN